MENRLGRKIEDLMRAQGFSQKQLSSRVGITEAALSRYINDQREPKAIILSAIAEELGVTMEDLLGVPSRDLDEVEGAVRLLSRSAEAITADQRKRLIKALLGE